MAMGLLAFQLLSLFSLLGISVIGVAIPFFFPAGKRGDHLLSCGNSFAGAWMCHTCYMVGRARVIGV